MKINDELFLNRVSNFQYIIYVWFYIIVEIENLPLTKKFNHKFNPMTDNYVLTNTSFLIKEFFGMVIINHNINFHEKFSKKR